MEKMRNGLEMGAQACRLIYRTGGMHGALVALMDICCENGLMLDRINALYVPSDLSLVVNIADTERLAPSTRRRPGAAPPILLWDRIREPLLVEDLEHYKSISLFKIPEFSDVPFLHFSSLARLPLSMSEDYVFLLNFWSEKRGAFQNGHMEMLQTLTAPLAEAVEVNQFASSLCSDASPIQIRTSQEKLELCPGLAGTLKMVRQVAPTHCPVLVIGETGSGKEAVVDAIHELSPRKNGPLIKVNCGAIPETLLDSELFGHEKGAFTGADVSRKGYFEEANGGTLVLDELGEMSISAQVRLLRVLESGYISRVGNPRPIAVDVRIIASTNADLRQLVANKKFRQDLWYRLSVFPITVPPLRRRKGDILPLVRHFLAAKAARLNLPRCKEKIREEDLKELYAHDWPGNVRELEHVVERALIGMDGLTGRIRFVVDDALPRESNCILEKWPTLKELESSYIRQVMEHCGNRLTGKHGAAAVLGIHYTTLRAHLRKMCVPGQN